MSDALVVAANDDWTKERVELVKRTVCPQGISDAELELFVEICRRSGLDPLTKEIFCVKRKLNVGSKDFPKWIERHEAQPAEAGLLARADRFADFRGVKAAAIYENDECHVNQDGVQHSFNPAQPRGKLVAAWAQAFREGRVLPVEVVRFDAYVQPTAQWNSKPDTMLVKCARAAALRRAYPNAFKGLYLREEMPSEEFEPAPTDTEARPPRARGLASIPKAALPPTTVTSNPLQVVDVQPGETEEAATLRTRAPKAAKVATEKKKPPLPEPASMSTAELVNAAQELQHWLAEYPNHRQKARAQARLTQLTAELEKRSAAPEAES